MHEISRLDYLQQVIYLFFHYSNLHKYVWFGRSVWKFHPTLHSLYLTYYLRCNSLFSKVFPNSLKKADITPIFTKGKTFLKNNDRPVSILPSVSKIYQRCIYDQISDYFHPLFSKLQCGFQNPFKSLMHNTVYKF